MRTLISRLLFLIILLFACLIIPGRVSMGEPELLSGLTSTSSVDCNLTPDPDDCFRRQSQINWQQGDFQSLPLSSQTVGLSGPLTSTLTYDNDLSWILGLSYIEMLNERFGLAIKASLGPNEWRGNLTAGIGLSDRHQVKLTYEYLTQNLPYDFASGAVNSWVNQHAFGGAYQYLLPSNIIHSLELSASYAKAQGKNLNDVVFYDGDDAYLNLRRIAAGQEATGLAKVNFLPVRSTLFALGAGYSQVQYDTIYENNQNNATLAYVAEIEHILHPTLKVSGAVNNTASNTDYTAKVSKILPKNFELSLAGQYQNSRGNLSSANSLTIGVTYPAPKAYTMNTLNKGLAELKSWIDRPVVYYTRVLAVKDELVKKYLLASQPIPSQTKAIAQTIDTIPTKNYFQFDATMYDQVQYQMKVMASGKDDSIDYASQLKLVLTQTNPYEAVLSSAQPIPGGQNLEGDYNITITATGMKKGLKQPITESRTMGLTVTYAGPVWTDKNLPSATAAADYIAVDLSQYSGTPNGYVVTPDLSSDQYTFKLISGPSWLQVQDQHVLVSTGPVPANASNTVNITLEVYSQSLHQSIEKVFPLQVKAGAPVWNGALPDGQYNVTYPNVNLADYLSTPGASTDKYTFSLSDNPGWLGLSSDGQSLVGNAPVPENQGNPVTVTVTAKSQASEMSVPQVFTIQLTPGIPKWTEDTLPDAQYGSQYESVDLAPMLYTPGLPNDSYQITLGPNSPPWLTIADGHLLVGTDVIPDSQSSPVTLVLHAYSTKTHLQAAPQAFLLLITRRGAPIWTNTELPEGIYGSSYNAVNLNDYVTTPGQTENYTYDLSGLPTWLTLADDGHTLKGIANIPDDAPDVIQIKATVTGSISKQSTKAVLAIRLRPGAPVWNGNLPAAQYNVTYGAVDLLPLVHTPGVQGDNYTFTIDAGPSWLKLGADGHSVAGSMPVPENQDSPITVKLSATSGTSKLSTPQNFTLTINPGAPIWTDKNLPNAQFGATYETVDLAPMVYTPGLPNDTFHMELAAGSPSWLTISSDGHHLTGVDKVPDNQPTPLQVTIKAISNKTALSTLQTFTLTVTVKGAPIWTNTELPDGRYADSYAPVDLNAYVATPGLSENYTFEITQAPTWLTLSNDGHTLVSTDVAPENSPNIVQIYINVTGDQSHQTTPGILSLHLRPGAPKWSGELPAAQYGINYSGADLLPLVHTPGEVTDNYTFTLDAAPNWIKLGADGHSLVSNGIVPENETSPVSVQITAKSAASELSTTQTFSVTINPGTPVWSNSNLPDAQYGAPYESVDLSPMVHTPGLPNDTFHMEFVGNKPDWLSIDGHTLIGTIPPDNETTPLQLTIKATSDKTGYSTPQIFTLVITTRSAPIWIQTELPDGRYETSYDPVDLNTYVTTPYQNESYQFDATQLPSWLKLSNDGHTLISDGVIPENTSNVEEVHITVTGNISKKSTPGILSLRLLPGAPVWSGNLPAAQYNAPYIGADLLPLVKTPGQVSDNYTFNIDNAPSWVVLGKDGHSLVANDTVPDTENNPVTIKLTATSAASQLSTSQTFTVAVNPGLPIWNGNLPDGQYDATYPTIDLSTMVHTPGLANDNYQMELAAGSPSWLAIDPKDGHSLIGTAPIPDNSVSPVQITIKAISQGTPDKLSATATFTFNLIKGLAWSETNPAAATAGDLSYSYPLDELVSCPANDRCSLNVSNLPAWLEVKTNPDGSSWLVNNKPVPAAAQDPAGTVSFDMGASSNNTQQTLQPKTFTINITNVLPDWQQDQIPGVIYDGTSTDGNNPDQTVHLNDYVKSGTNAGLSFLPGPGFDSKSWAIINPAGTTDYYLTKLAPGDTTEIDTQAQVPVLAMNSTSAEGKSHDVLVNLLPNNGLPNPIWDVTTLPNANMGAIYGDSGAIIDLNTMVSTTGVNNDSFYFAFDDTTQPHPEWLDSVSLSKTGHLTSAGEVPMDAGVPCTSGVSQYDVCFNVAIMATSKASGQSQSYTFKDVPITQALPSWSTTPPVDYSKWSMVYDDTVNGIELDQYISGSKTNLTFSIAQQNGNWQIVDQGGNHYLRRTTGVDPLPSDINTTVSIRIVAHNTTSTTANQGANAYKDIQITVLPDISLNAPVWDGVALPDADMGYAYPQSGNIDLTKKVATPQVSNDQYSFAFDDSDPVAGPHPSWLIINNGQLMNDPAVNNNEVPKTATSPFTVKIIATSLASGRSTTYTFSNVKVNQTEPVWQGVQQTTLAMNDTATSIPPTDTLKGWIKPGTDKNIAFQIDSKGMTNCANNFITANWNIPSSNPANIFRTDAGAINAADVWNGSDSSVVALPVLASNDTSAVQVASCIPVKVTNSSNLPYPIWNTTTLPSATMGDIYGNPTIDLNSMVSTSGVSNDSFKFAFDDSTLPHPAWLDSTEITKTGHLISTGNVPMDGGVACSSGAPYDVCFNVAIIATSQASGHSQSYTFKDVPIIQTLPTWSTTPPVDYSKWNMVYDDTTNGIELDQYISGGKTNLTFSIVQQNGNWQIVDQGGNHYLRRVTGADPLPSDINTTVSIRIVAQNNTSTTANQAANAYKDIQITVLPDSSLDAPVWDGVALPDADMGYTYPQSGSIDLTQKVSTPQISKDQYTFTFDDSDPVAGPHPSWLIINNGLLMNDPALNNNEVPKTAASPFTVKIIATSLASGRSTTYTYSNIQVNQTEPVWQGVQQTTLAMNDTTTSIPPTDTLKGWIKPGTDKNITFQIDNKGVANCANNFITANWDIPGSNPANIFRTDAGAINAADVWNGSDSSIVAIPVVASNDTSVAPAAYCIPVQVTTGNALPLPTWNTTTLPGAIMGDSYGSNPIIDLNTMVSTVGISNDKFKFSFDDATLQHPVWLDSAQISKTGHLISTGNVPINGGVACSSGTPYDVCFNVAILATSAASGQSQSYTFKDVPIAQTLPIWSTTPPVDYSKWSMFYDDTSQGIELGQYITDGKTNLTFSIAQQNGNWQIVNEGGVYYLRRTTGADPLPSDINSTVTVRIVAQNSTSTTANQNANAYKDIQITVLPDSKLLPPVWDAEVLPDADMGYAYPKTGTVDLNKMVSTPQVGNDQYTFAFDDTDQTIGAHPDWLVINNGVLTNDPTKYNNEVPKSAASPFAVKIKVTSLASNNSVTYTFSNIKVNQVQPVWQGIQQSTLQFNDLTTSIPPTGTLKNWMQSGTDKNVVFQINTSGKTSCATNFINANWDIPTSNPVNIFRTQNGKMDAADVWDGTEATLVNIPVLASNDTSTATIEGCVPVKVTPDTTKNPPEWLSTNFPPIYGGEPGIYPYSVVMSNFITDGENSAFLCKIVSPDAPWLIVNPNNSEQLINDPNINGGGVPALDDKPQVTVNCQSRASAQWTGAKTFTVDVAPVLKQATTIPTSIRFDDITTGIKLYDLLISGRKNPAFTLTGAAPGYIAANWAVVNGTDGFQYLRRKPVNTNQIDAQDLTGSTQGKVTINVKATNSTSSVQAAKDVLFTLLPDHNLYYKYSGGVDQNDLAVLEPAPAPGIYQSGNGLFDSTVHGFYLLNADTPYQIINDSPYVYGDPGGQPPYISYANLPKLDIGYPPLADQSNQKVNWSVAVSTIANGGGSSGKGVNMMMPTLSFPDLILTPPASNGTSGIMVLGNSKWIYTDLVQYFYTYLQVSLKPNTKYLLKQMSYESRGNNANWAQICPGRVTQTDSSTTCPTGPQLGTFHNGVNSVTFTTNSSGVVTFILNAVYVGATGQYPIFLTSPGNPISPSQNIRLGLQ